MAWYVTGPHPGAGNEVAALPGLQVSAGRLPGARTPSLAGDFCEVLPLAGGGATLIIGNVEPDVAAGSAAPAGRAGAGQPDAGSAALARSVLRATVDIESRPSLILQALHRALLAWPAADGQGVAATCVTVRPTRFGARGHVCAAGSPPALAWRADGSLRWLGSSGPILGRSRDPHLADARLTLWPGDGLVLATRSLVTAPGAGGQPEFGAERLRQVVAGLRAASAAPCGTTAAVSPPAGRPRWRSGSPGTGAAREPTPPAGPAPATTSRARDGGAQRAGEAARASRSRRPWRLAAAVAAPAQLAGGAAACRAGEPSRTAWRGQPQGRGAAARRPETTRERIVSKMSSSSTPGSSDLTCQMLGCSAGSTPR